jgi:hypothetical protein
MSASKPVPSTASSTSGRNSSVRRAAAKAPPGLLAYSGWLRPNAAASSRSLACELSKASGSTAVVRSRGTRTSGTSSLVSVQRVTSANAATTATNVPAARSRRRRTTLRS